MKLWRTLALVVVVLTAALGSVALANDGPMLKLGELPEGWYASRGEPGIYIEETSGLPALRLRPRVGSAQNAWDGAFTLFPAETERVIVEFDAYAPGLFRSLAVSVSYQEDPHAKATANYGAYLTVHDGARLTYYVANAGWFEFGRTIDTFQWNHFKMDVDVAGQTYTLYVNDMEKPIGTAIFRNAVPVVNQVEFSTWGYDTTEYIWIRDVQIYKP